MTDPEIVPGMAEAIEHRMELLGMSPGEFAIQAGLSRTAVAHVRAGHRRAYQRRLTRGVAGALRWPNDWYARLLAGEDPREWVEPAREVRSNGASVYLSSDAVVQLLLDKGLTLTEAVEAVHRALDGVATPAPLPEQPRPPVGRPEE